MTNPERPSATRRGSRIRGGLCLCRDGRGALGAVEGLEGEELAVDLRRGAAAQGVVLAAQEEAVDSARHVEDDRRRSRRRSEQRETGVPQGNDRQRTGDEAEEHPPWAAR
jgi:hypothetical protein